MSAVATKQGLSFSVPVADLLHAVEACSAMVSQRSRIALLRGILIDADADGLTLTATDGTGLVRRKVSAMVTGAGSIVIDAKILNDALSSVSGNTECVMMDGVAKLKAENSSFKLMTLPGEDFPEFPDVDAAWTLDIAAGDLRRMVRSVNKAVLKEDSVRDTLKGIQIQLTGGELTLIATDSHRIHVAKTAHVGDSLRCLLRPQDLAAILAIGYSDTDTVSIKGDLSRVKAENGGVTVVAQQILGTYPNWERAIPGDGSSAWVVEKEGLSRAVKAMMPWASTNANRVTFSQDGGRLRVHARSEEKGESDALVDVVGESDVKIAANGRYVLDVLDACPDVGVRIELTSSSRPMKFLPVEEAGWTGVIMPLALV